MARTKSEAKQNRVAINNRFLDKWFELHPRIYNQFFDGAEGDSVIMINDLRNEKPAIYFRILSGVKG